MPDMCIIFTASQFWNIEIFLHFNSCFPSILLAFTRPLMGKQNVANWIFTGNYFCDFILLAKFAKMSCTWNENNMDYSTSTSAIASVS